MTTNRALEGHARGMAKSIYGKSAAYSMLVMTEGAKAVLLHKLSLEPSEACVEAAARALAKADGKDPDAPAWVRFPGAHPSGICWRDQYADKARTALQSLRDTRRQEIRDNEN